MMMVTMNDCNCVSFFALVGFVVAAFFVSSFLFVFIFICKNTTTTTTTTKAKTHKLKTIASLPVLVCLPFFCSYFWFCFSFFDVVLDGPVNWQGRAEGKRAKY